MQDAQDYRAGRSSHVEATNLPEEQRQSQEDRPRPDSSSISKSPVSEPGQRKDMAESSAHHAMEAHLKIRYSKVLFYVFCSQFVFQIVLGLCLAGVFKFFGNVLAATMVTALVAAAGLIVVDDVRERLWQIQQGTKEYP
jgi:hypothetical protein